jgi:hypothetical protein
MLNYFGPRYFRARYFWPVSGNPEDQGAALLANRRFMVNMGSMMNMGGM